MSKMTLSNNVVFNLMVKDEKKSFFIDLPKLIYPHRWKKTGRRKTSA